jgi:hypothetical protein
VLRVSALAGVDNVARANQASKDREIRFIIIIVSSSRRGGVIRGAPRGPSNDPKCSGGQELWLEGNGNLWRTAGLSATFDRAAPLA